jgi:hypothetical protein
MKDGGPAFPRPCAEASGDKGEMWNDSECGMSLRDYFAAAALQGYIASFDAEIGVPDEVMPKIASRMYRLADAMLKARA